MRMYALQITEEEMERKRDYAFCDRYRSVRSRKKQLHLKMLEDMGYFLRG